MFKFFKKHKKVTLLGSLITFSLTSVIVATVAWFQVEGRDTITDITIPSGVVANYFEGKNTGTWDNPEYHFGDGSQDDPFIIARPEQLFNLMELMKSDTAKMTSESSVFYNNQYYFQFGIDYGSGPMFYDYTDEGTLASNSKTPTSKVLNMKYYSDRGMLSPIGSPRHPFIGHIEGHNLTVDKITIDGTDCSDVGIFGYIAAPGSVHNVYFDHLQVDVGISDLSGQNIGSHDTHKHVNNAAVGYIVGHVYDANLALSNVYVNNCSIINQSAGNKAVSNNFGYIGCSDANEIIGDSSETNTELKASSLHNYLENNYATIGGNKFATSYGQNAQSVTRDAGYSNSTSKLLNQMITKSDSTYTFTNSSANSTGNTSLATAGYTSDETVIRDLQFQKDSTTFEDISPSTQVLSSLPDTSTLSDGYYIYFDNSKDGTTNSKWQYLEVKTEAGIITTVQLNCFYMSYTIDANKYYLTYNSGNLVPTPTTPAQASADQRPNYYFCLRESAGSYGISSYSTANAQTNFHIYSPANDKYLNASTSGVSSNFTFINNFSSSLEFAQLHGNNSPIVVKDNDQYKFLCSSSSVTLKRFVSTDGEAVPILFEGASYETQPSYASDYTKVTDASALAAGDIITFVYNDSGTYYAIADQAKNNRLTTKVTMSESNTKIEGENASSLSSFKLEGNSSAWEFRDTYSNQYLYAAGQKSSGQNYLRSQDTNNSKGQWTISISSGSATVHSNGNSSVPYLDYATGQNNEGTYHIFRAFRSASSKPMIFKRSQISGQTTYIYSSFKYEVQTTSTSTPEVNPYSLRYSSAIGATITTSSDLLNQADPIFLISTSQVRIKLDYKGILQLVTSASQLEVNAQYTLATFDHTTSGVTYYDFASNANYQYAINTTGEQSNTVYPVTDNSAQCTDDILLFELGTDSSYYTFLTKNVLLYNDTDENGYLTSATNVAQTDYQHNLTRESTIQTNSHFSINIDSSTHIATIMSVNSSYDEKYLRYQEYTKSNKTHYTFRMTQASESNSGDVYLFKYIPLGNPTYIGDQVGDNYNPNYIDAVGSFESSSTAMTFTTSSAASAPSLSTKFQAPSSLGNSVVIFAEYNGSMDLGRIDIEYTGNYLKINKPGALKSVEGDLGIPNNGDSTNRINTIFITTNNIHKFALCALDSSGNVVATFNDSGVASGSVTNAKYYVINFRANGGSVAFSRIAYSFTQLPGNNGNFGHVGYRSADYTSSTYSDGVWSQTAITHATSTTILNYYFNTAAGVYSYIYVSFDHTNMRYNITAYCTQASELYLFNYDPTVYTVYVNGAPVIAGSNVVHINATAYDFNTGWAT